MAYNADSQNPVDPTQPPPQASGGDTTNSWYYRPSSGLPDWSAQMARATQGNIAGAAGGTINGEDLQLPNISLQNRSGMPDPSTQNTPGGLAPSTAPGATSGSGNVPDFLSAPASSPAQGPSVLNAPRNGNPQTPAAAPAQSPAPQPPKAPQADISDIGTPNIPKDNKGTSFSGSVATDWDGSPDAYGVRGTPTAYTGKDKLDNASRGENYDPTKKPEDSLLPDIIPRDANGKALTNSQGYYQSATSVQDSQNKDNYNYIDGEKIPYVAISKEQMAQSHANYGDYVWVQNTKTGQGTWAIIGDYRGSVPDGGPKQAIELSPATQDRIGINRVADGNHRGEPAGDPQVSMTVYANTAGGRFH